MREINKKLLMLFATLTTIIAATVASSACFWGLYQPEEPKSLREE